jgi:hypothetical protein
MGFAVPTLLPHITAPLLLICITSLGSFNCTVGAFCAVRINAAGTLIQSSIFAGKVFFTWKLTIFIWLIWLVAAVHAKHVNSSSSCSFFIEAIFLHHKD